MSVEFEEHERERLLSSLDEFDVTEEMIGAGGYGTVYKGRIRSTGQPVAMKKVGGRDPEQSYQALLMEFKLMCSVSHPAIQYVIGLYHPDDWTKTVLVTPFYKNGSVTKFIRENPDNASRTTKACIALGVCAAMAKLHKAEISHRDLKAENVLLNDNLWPVVIDFGVSRRFTPDILMSTEVGSLRYMAPELLEGADGYDNSIDVYSFGLFLYELFTGTIPFREVRTIGELRQQKSSYSLVIPRTVPKLFAALICMCNRPAAERPTFKKLLRKILKGYRKLNVNQSIFEMYNNVLCTKELQFTKFRIPKQIVQLQRPDEETEDKCPILFDELKSILEREGDRHVIIVMVIGGFEVGKSTYLRTLTGNAAFYPGNGETSQTQGLLLDGPYHVSDLIDRIPDDDLKEKCSRIHIPSDPSIYFLDCQGIGDEKYEREQKLLLERVTAIFASVSSICINVCKFADSYEAMKANIVTMRRGQLIGSASRRFSELLFLVRDYSDDFNMRIADYSPEDYDEILEDFRNDWIREHGGAASHYLRESVHIAPLGNPKSDLQSYTTTVWESLHKILTLMAGAVTRPPTALVFAVDFLSKVLYSINFDWWIKFFNEQPSDPSVSDGCRRCCACCSFLVQYIHELLYESGASIEPKDVHERITEMMFIVVHVVLPYFLGADEITGRDFLQYCVEISKDTETYMKLQKDWWLKISKEWRNCRKARWAVVGIVMALEVPIMCIPGGLGVAAVWAYGICANIGWWSTIKVERNRIESVKNDNITMLFPPIWRRSMTAPSWFHTSVTDTSKIVKPLSKRLLLAFYEQPNKDSRLLVQSLIGVQLPETLEAGKSHCFTSLNVSELLRRQVRDTKELKILPSMPEKIDFIYLGHISAEEQARLSHVLGASTVWVTSQLVEREDLIQLQLPPDLQANLRVFVLSDGFFDDAPVIMRQPFIAELNRITARYRELNSTGSRSFYLPICAPDYDFESSGPRTNVAIRYCCRYVLGEQLEDTGK